MWMMEVRDDYFWCRLEESRKHAEPIRTTNRDWRVVARKNSTKVSFEKIVGINTRLSGIENATLLWDNIRNLRVMQHNVRAPAAKLRQ